MPDFLCEELQDYISKLYGVFPTDRIFHITKSFLHHEMSRGASLTPDVDGMSDEELEEASEVFALPDGKYLIVEG